MKIQLLYSPSCPNHEATRANLHEALEGFAGGVEEIDVDDPAAPDELRGWGSPTILIDGVDVLGLECIGAPACRVYGGTGIIPRDQIRAALERRR